MLLKTLAFAALFSSGVEAHFRLLFPEPRGLFVADKQPEFCGGYTNVTTNRTTFPLEGGFFRVRQGHENWTASVLISTVPNPNTFDAFSSDNGTQYARHWANELLTGNFCIPLDLSNTGIAGITDGANVTIQVAFAGSDGDLYQCADLTLSASANISAEEQGLCKNETTAHGHGGGSQASSGGEPAATGGAGSNDEDGGSLGSVQRASLWAAVAMSVVGGVSVLTGGI